jgi:TonB family protein
VDLKFAPAIDAPYVGQFMTNRRKILIALALSALLHLLFIVVVVVASILLPKKPPVVTKPPKPLEITIAPLEPEKVAVVKPKPTPTPKPQEVIRRDTILSDGLKKTDVKDENAMFESDENLVAGSTLPSAGNVPLPSQAGRKLPFAEFQNQQYTPGQKAGASQAATRPQPARPAEQSQQQTLQKRIAKVEPTPSATPISTPQPTPQPTPPPTADRLFALGKPTPLPIPESPQQPRQQMAMLRPPQPQTNRSGFQPQQVQTEIEGSISNRGPTGVSALSTPRGRFEKILRDAIGSRWNYYVSERQDLLTVGSATVKFAIDRNGKVLNVEVVENSSNETFASVCVQAVKQAEIPPLPQELYPQMQDGVYPVNFSFNFY